MSSKKNININSKRGRPKKNNDDKRYIRHVIRFNEKENKKLMDLIKPFIPVGEEKIKTSTLIRQILLESEINCSIKNEDEELNIFNTKLIFEVNKIGNNINQIAKVIHQKNNSFDSIYVKNELTKLNEEMNLLKSILIKISK